MLLIIGLFPAHLASILRQVGFNVLHALLATLVQMHRLRQMVLTHAHQAGIVKLEMVSARNALLAIVVSMLLWLQLHALQVTTQLQVQLHAHYVLLDRFVRNQLTIQHIAHKDNGHKQEQLLVCIVLEAQCAYQALHCLLHAQLAK